MDNKAIESELINLERQYWQSMKDKDADKASRLTDYPCIVTGAQGVASIADSKTFAAMMNNGGWELKDFTLGEDIQVRLVSDDVAIVAYKVKENLTVEDKPVTLEAADASVWVKRDGKWLCALHTESVAGDPFGRDRQTAH